MPGFQFMSKMAFVQSAIGGGGFTSESVEAGIASGTIAVVAGVLKQTQIWAMYFLYVWTLDEGVTGAMPDAFRLQLTFVDA